MSDHSHSRDELVVAGAGLVGCVLALFLARRGHAVHVYESRPDPRLVPPVSDRSTHLVVSARGFKALAAVGADELVRSLAIPVYGRTIHAADGRLNFQPYGAEGQAIFAVNRAAMNTVLSDLASCHERIQISFDHRCETLDPQASKVRIRHHDQVTDVAFQRLFGADGAFSKVRQALLPHGRFDYTQTYVAHGYKELALPARGVEWPLSHDSMHVWPRRSAMLAAFPNRDRSFTAMLVLPFEGPSSFGSLRTPADLIDCFERLFPDALPLMPDLIDDFFARQTASIATIRCFPWTYRDRIALVGDAAHSMVPFLGQGLNAGFEDCTVLDSLLDEYGDDWQRIFTDYERRRKPNCDAITDLSLRNFNELSELVGDPTFLRQKRLEMKLHQQFPERFVPLYSMVAFSDIPYLEVAARATRQETLVRELLARTPPIEQHLDQPEISKSIEQRMLDLPPFTGRIGN